MSDVSSILSAAIAFPQDLDELVNALRAARTAWRDRHPRHTEHGTHFPSRRSLDRIMRELGAALFPLRLGPPELTASNENAYIGATLESVLSQLEAQIGIELRLAAPDAVDDDGGAEANRIIGTFAANLPNIRRLLDSDVEAGYVNDPAARSVDEVLLFYPSITAVIHYRVAHILHRLGAPIVARIVTEIAHAQTGIDIHPGATIGRSFFIDHGTGVVIGETAVIGDRVRLFQGVTLGGAPAPNGCAQADRNGARRHPTIEDDVVLFAGASIIGDVRIGARSAIASNVLLRTDVPPDSIVEPAPPRIAGRQADPSNAR